MDPAPRHFAVIPAAGTGRRLGAGLPKQYLRLGDRTVIEWSVAPFADAHWIQRVVVVVAPDDERADELFGNSMRVQVARVGGATRRDSVIAGLQQLGEAREHDWVIVHDAARPGLSPELLQCLRVAVADDPVGGLLALPVSDTVKRADERTRVAGTMPREGLWLAQTPQMFRYGLLRDALARQVRVTDESGAIEAEGHHPLLVMGSHENFKVTTAGDFVMMQRLFANLAVSARAALHR